MKSQFKSAHFVLLFMILLAGVLIGCSPNPVVVKEVKTPNVLFLFADDQRADTLSAWGNPNIRTPNLDTLVEEGFSFRSNYNMGGNSGAVCVPSRAMVNSGLAYFRVPNDLSGTTLLPELLGENGFTTFATGKWHNKEPSWLRGFQQGKSVFFGGMSDHTQVPVVDLSPSGEFINKRRGEKFSSELFADAVIDFLQHYSDEKPFYAYVAFTAPHDPRQPPAPDRDFYYENRPPLPNNFLAQHPFNLGPNMVGRDERLAAWPRTEEVVRDQLGEYYGMITHLDSQIGRILKTLKETGHDENTIIIYAADQGLAVGSHGLLGKQNIYEHSQRCPLIFVGPDIPKGQSSNAFTYLLDIFPTVTSLTGVTTPSNLDGSDLSMIWRGEKQQVRDSVFLGFRDWARSVRGNRYKLIRYPQIEHTQLFDLQADPDEMNNLADDPEHADRIEKMLALLKEWQQKLGDDQPLVVADPQPKDIDLTGREREPDQWQPDWILRKYF